MYTIKSIEEHITEIQKSKFICRLIKLSSINQVNDEMKKIKEDYKNATHYCYGYIFENKKKCSDDGEPSGTAGLPILNVLENNNLNNILCIIVRYFGGIKLGAGGLVRAYTQSVTNTLENTELMEIKKGKKIEIIFPYNQEKRINYLLHKFNISEKYFENNIKYILYISDDDLVVLNDNNITYNIIEDNIYI